MQVRHILAASLLALTAVGTMAQEIDRSETLQAKSLAAQQAASSNEGRTRESVVAEARNVQAAAQIRVGEQADAPIVQSVPNTAVAHGRTRKEVRQELAEWRKTHKMVVGDLG